MVYSLYNYHEFSIYRNNEDIMGIVHNNEDIDQNDSLNRLIKACVQIVPSGRPKMEEIVQFLNGEIEYFEYELRDVERLKNERVENEGVEKERLEEDGQRPLGQRPK
uniref:Uncharacterized protein n=1 Tax=Meloidogyne floridensis TaxID=298350 RepID=A0A915NM14_9BILA